MNRFGDCVSNDQSRRHPGTSALRHSSRRGFGGTAAAIPALLLLPVVLSLASCSKPFSVPRPGSAPAPAVPPAEPSTIQLPVSIDISSILPKIEASVPRQLSQSGDWMVVDRNAIGDVGIRYQIERDPLQISFSERTAHVTSRIRYSIEAAQRVTKPFVGGTFWQPLGSCGKDEPRREAVIGLDVAFSIASDWRVLSKSSVPPAVFAHQCRMTFLKINVTDKVAGAFAAALGRAAVTVDTSVARMGNLRPMVQRAWERLQVPVDLGNGAWLSMAPTGLGLQSVNGSGTTLDLTVAMTAAPRVAIGSAPSSASKPLPALRAGSVPAGFHVTADLAVTFAELERRSRDGLLNKPLKSGGNTVTITSLDVYGAGEKLVVGLGLVGDLKGTVYLVGTPAVDPARGILYVRDLDFSLETRQALLAAANWLNHEGFRREVSEAARVDLSSRIAETRTSIIGALNRQLSPGINATGAVSGLHAAGVYVTADGVLARIVVDGALKLTVR